MAPTIIASIGHNAPFSDPNDLFKQLEGQAALDACPNNFRTGASNDDLSNAM